VADSVQLLIGPYKSGKTHRILREMFLYKQSHPLSPCTILVPSERNRSATRKRLDRMLQQDFNMKLAFNLHIQAFYPFCESILKAARADYRVLPEDLRALVLSSVLDQLQAEGKLRHLAKLVGFQGTASALLKLIDEFERAGFTPSAVLANLAESSAEQSRYVELAIIYDAYWRRLSRLGCIDQKQLAFEARELLFSHRLAGFHHGMILVEGFDRISSLQADIIAALARYADSVLMAFDYSEGAEAAGTGPTYEWNRSSFAHLTRHIQPQLLHQSGNDIDNTITVSEPISVFRALDRFAEMKEIAGRCKQAIKLRGRRPDQLLVVARHIDNYRGAVEAAFDEAGVPYFLDLSMQAQELPFIQFVLDLLKLPLKNNSSELEFARATTVACLRSKFLNSQALNLTLAEVEHLDAKSLAAAIIGGKEQWQKVLVDCPDPLRTAVENFFELLCSLNVISPLSQHCQALENLLEKLVSLPSQRDTDAHSKLLQRSRQGERTMRRCLQALVQEEQLLKTGAISFHDFAVKLETLSGRGSFTAHGGNQAVLITSADTAPNDSFAEIFIAGLVEGEFPKRGGQAGFAGQDELARWTGFGIELVNPRAEPGFETALYRSLIARAEKVTLSFPQFEMAGEEKIPSFFVAEAQGKSEAQVPLTEPMSAGLSQPVSEGDALGGWLWYRNSHHNLELPNALSENDSVASAWQNLGDSIVGGVSRLLSGSASVYNGYLTPLVESQAVKIAERESWSASALNHYGQCPFKYWLSQVLKLTPRTEGAMELSAALQGSTYHKVLEVYYRLLSEQKIDFRSGVDEAAFEQALSEGFNWLSEEREFNAGPYWSNEKQDIRLRLRRFLQWESRTRKSTGRPVKFEVKFGRRDEGSEPPLVLQMESGKHIKVSGAIDRIDMETPEGSPTPLVHLVDYKSGSTTMKPEDALTGINIQLPLYALAVEQTLMPGAMVGTASYLSVRQAKTSGNFNFKSPAHMDMLHVTRQHVNNFVRGASKGDYRVKPANSDVCKTCEHVTVCRISELRTAQSDGDDSYD
jgi:ATP-dependent helicase/DNAse subunit B